MINLQLQCQARRSQILAHSRLRGLFLAPHVFKSNWLKWKSWNWFHFLYLMENVLKNESNFNITNQCWQYLCIHLSFCDALIFFQKKKMALSTYLMKGTPLVSACENWIEGSFNWAPLVTKGASWLCCHSSGWGGECHHRLVRRVQGHHRW